MKLSDNLYYLRKRDKITQEELADKLNVSRQSVSKWETGEAYPDTDKLIAMSDMFDVTIDALVKGDLSQGARTISDPPAETNEPKGEKTSKIGYNAHMNMFARNISLGVFLILLGVALCVAITGTSTTFTGETAALLEFFGVAALLLCIAAAVFIFVLSGLKHERFKKNHPVVISDYCKDEKERFDNRFTPAVACLVSAIIVDVIFLVAFAFLIDNGFIAYTDITTASCAVVAAFLLMLGAIIGGLVFFGIQKSKFDLSEYDKETGKDIGGHESRRSKIASAIDGAIMMIATILFLVLGFIWNLWHPGWIVFPVGGILCGIVGVIATATEEVR